MKKRQVAICIVAGNYRLKPSSPCINAGTNQLWMAAATDLDGNARIYRETHFNDVRKTHGFCAHLAVAA